MVHKKYGKCLSHRPFKDLCAMKQNVENKFWQKLFQNGILSGNIDFSMLYVFYISYLSKLFIF